MTEEFGITEVTVQVEEYEDSMEDCKQCQDPKDWKCPSYFHYFLKFSTRFVIHKLFLSFLLYFIFWIYF